MFVALAFLLGGLIIGSFLNVVILRHGVRDLRGRSACISCGERLRWFDLVPVLSWAALRGRCRNCGMRISIQYPLVELSTGILFALIGYWAGDQVVQNPWFLPIVSANLCITALLIAIFVYDLYHTIIPDEWVYPFILLAFISQFLMPFSGDFSAWWLIVAGPLAASPLFALWFFSRGAWMGFGDVKLALGIGWLLGPLAGILSVFLAFVIGGIASVPLLLLSSERFAAFLARITPNAASRKWHGSFTMKSEIPFGPFLILACLIVWFSQMYNIHVPILSVYGL